MNILLLMAVSFLPFPTALMAESLKASHSAERAAVVVYGGVALVIEALGAAMWRYAASRPGLLPEDGAPLPEHTQRHNRTVRGALYGVALFLGILLLPKLAAFGYFIVAAFAVLSARGEGRLSLRGPPPAR
jgi:uncharacterized membrane protein